MNRVRRLAYVTRHRDEARCSRGIGRRGAKCPAGRLRLLRLGGNMRSWVLLLLLAALSAALLRLGSAEGDPLPSSLVDLVRNPISSVDDLKLLLQQETNAIEEEKDGMIFSPCTMADTLEVFGDKDRYINRKAHYDKAIISVEDPSASMSILPFPAPSRSDTRQPQDCASKADLHRHIDLSTTNSATILKA
ncbi:bromodomain-containing protein 4 [Lates japonicus]|uniref:Bromodomain-containing protein 4 n=1 Tax=Lates japonicus TaxID=270547 RepID=A0AAD3NG19_LATJO|nr:bromodomain-containing protein 4 [Lates japonicus]